MLSGLVSKRSLSRLCVGRRERNVIRPTGAVSELYPGAPHAGPAPVVVPCRADMLFGPVTP